MNALNRTGLRTEPRGAQSVSLSILPPDSLPLQSPWFRYAFLHGPSIHLLQSESNFPGDLGCDVKVQISKQYVILPHLTVYFPSPIVFLCPVALCIKAIWITLSHVKGEVTVTHTTMLFCSPFGAVLPSACPHSWLSPQKAATINQTSKWVICSQRALWAHKVVAGRKRPTGEPGGQQTFAFHYKWVQGKWSHPSMGCQILIQSYFPPSKPNILPFLSLSPHLPPLFTNTFTSTW